MSWSSRRRLATLVTPAAGTILLLISCTGAGEHSVAALRVLCYGEQLSADTPADLGVITEALNAEVVVENCGTAPVTFTRDAVQINGDPEFSVDTSGMADLLEPGDATALAVNVTPQRVAGVRSAHVSLSFLEQSLSFGIEATMDPPSAGQLAVLRDQTVIGMNATVDFGSIEDICEIDFTVSNVGDLPLSFSAPAISLSGDPEFSLSRSITAEELAGGSSAGFTVRLEKDPDRIPGSKSGAVTISYAADASADYAFAVTGRVNSAPHLELTYADSRLWSNGTVSLGTLPASPTPASYQVVLTNTGDAALQLGDHETATPVALLNGADPELSLSSVPEPMQLAPGASTSIVVGVSAGTVSGERSAILHINSDDPVAPEQTVELLIEIPAPEIQLLTNETTITGTLDLGSVTDGSSYTDTTVTVRNNGVARLTMPEAPVSPVPGGAPEISIVSQPAALELSAGETAHLVLRAERRSSTGTVTATFQVESSDPAGDAELVAQAHITQPQLSISAAAHGTVAVDDSVALGETAGRMDTVLTIANTGDATLELGAMSVSGEQEFALAAAPALTTLPPGDTVTTATLRLQRYDAVQRTGHSATVSVPSNDPDGACAFHVTGYTGKAVMFVEHDVDGDGVWATVTNGATISLGQTPAGVEKLSSFRVRSAGQVALWVVDSRKLKSGGDDDRPYFMIVERPFQEQVFNAAPREFQIRLYDTVSRPVDVKQVDIWVSSDDASAPESRFTVTGKVF